MFRRDVKKQFNENKYNLLSRKGEFQRTQLAKVPFQKHFVATLAMMVLGFNYTKRFYTLPHFHKDTSQPMFLSNGELHPGEKQPKGTTEKYPAYTKHLM